MITEPSLLNIDHSTLDLDLSPADNKTLANFCGPVDQNIHFLERALHVKIAMRFNHLKITGPKKNLKNAKHIILLLYKQSIGSLLTTDKITIILEHESKKDYVADNKLAFKVRKSHIKPRSKHQAEYMAQLNESDISFGIGPAGTGKTYLAVARAVELLDNNLISRIVLVRPAVEAGEKLGFLPGTISDKVNPYLQPLYDALYDLLGYEDVNRMLERNIIEIASLAYMRGRTLNNACIILDEGQNTTILQMKMFLTRLGFNSRAIITGDLSQIDLPPGVYSGLKHAAKILQNIPTISFCYFDREDVSRHPIIKSVLDAYDEDKKEHYNNKS